MYVRANKFWIVFLVSLLAWLSLMASGAVHAESSVPLSNAWNVATTGKAESSGELLFRVTPPGDSDPVEITVFVSSGSNETGVASSTRRALSSQLGSNFNVAAGQGANVLV